MPGMSMFGCGILKWAYVDDVDDVDPELSSRVRGLISVILPQCKWMSVSWWLSVVKFKWMEIPARAMWTRRIQGKPPTTYLSNKRRVTW